MTGSEVKVFALRNRVRFPEAQEHLRHMTGKQMDNRTGDNIILVCCLDSGAKIYTLTKNITQTTLTRFVLQAQGKRTRAAPVYQ